MRSARIAFAGALAFGLVAATARAQTPPTSAAPQQTAQPPQPAAAPQAPLPPLLQRQSQRLDNVRAELGEIEKALLSRDLSDAEIKDARTRLDALSRETQDALIILQPGVAAIKTRLDQLGPKPAAGAPPESPANSSERDEQQKLYNAIDGLVKRASLFSKQIEQEGDAIAARRRGRFARALLARTSSALDPRLWIGVAGEAPHDSRAAVATAGEWVSNATATLNRLSVATLGAALIGVALAYAILGRIAYRVNLRDPAATAPSPPRKATAALWGALVDIVAPIAATLAVIGLLRSFGLVGDRLEPLADALFQAVARIAFVTGVGRALLAPGLPAWRPAPVSDATADKIYRLAIIAAGLIAVTKVLESVLQVIGADLETSIALRGASALLIALIVARHLQTLAIIDEADDGPETVASGAPEGVRASALGGPLRLAVWAAVVAIGGAAIVGYIALATFLVDQAIWAVFVGATLFLIVSFLNRSIEVAFQPRAPLGRLAINGVGLRRESLEQISVLLSGAAMVVLAGVALMLVLAPWGVQSDDLFSGFDAAFFGFSVGGVTVSLSSVAVALILFGLAWGATRALQTWLEDRFLPHTQLDAGLRNSIRTSFGYIGFIVAAALALSYLGLSFDKLAIVAGALSVGIGFGLQSIVNNFVSGLILLWERAIRVGDWVVVGDAEGFVRRINVRSTEIETFDRAMMIVPNSNLVSGVVKNWVRGDRTGRIRNSISVVIDADPAKVRDALLACAGDHELVQKFPAPAVQLVDTSGGALKMDLLCFIADVERSLRVRSDLNFAIVAALKAEGIAPYAPPAAAPAEIKLVNIGELRTSSG